MVNTESQLLSRRMIVPLFMICGFVGGLALIIASIFVPGFFGPGSLSRATILGGVGVVVLAIGVRPRVVRYDPLTHVVQIGWGVRWTRVYKTIQPNDWIALSVQKVFPVVVMKVGSVTRASSLPPYWKLFGMRKNFSSVFLAEYSSEQAAAKARDFFAQQFHLTLKQFSATVRLTYGSPRGSQPDEAWKSELFFRKQKQHGLLYAALCESGKWQFHRGGNIYDADVPELLAETWFDISLLASRVQVSKPWEKLLDMAEAGWVKPLNGMEELRALAQLEKRCRWVTPDMVR